MNIENVNRAADAYLATAEGAAAARLEFLMGLWAIQADLAASAPAHTVPTADDARDALATGQHLFLVSPPQVPADDYRSAVGRVAGYVAESGVLDESQTASLAGTDLSSVIDEAAVATALTDFDSFVAQASAALADDGAKAAPSAATVGFILHAALVPFLTEASADAVAALGEFDWSIWSSGHCPVCGAAAALGRMGESTKLKGSGRSLWCSQCHAEWGFERLRCARCGSRDQEKLRYTFEEGDPAHRLHLCDQCHGYLKVSFFDDLDKPLSMLVEETASVTLDAIARDQGYTSTGMDA